MGDGVLEWVVALVGAQERVLESREWVVGLENMCRGLRIHVGAREHVLKGQEWVVGLENGWWGLRTCAGSRERVLRLENICWGPGMGSGA